MADIHNVTVRRERGEREHLQWKMRVNDERTNQINIADGRTVVRFSSEETSLRIYIPERDAQPKKDFILERGEAKEINVGRLEGSLTDECAHHSFIIMALEDHTFVTGSTIPEFVMRR